MDLAAEDRALLEALTARGAASVDEDPVIAMRSVCRSGATGLSPQALRAVWGRIEAARPGFGPVLASGALAAALTADRWGPVFALSATPEEALARARKGGRAVIALNGQPWWARLLAEPDLTVTAALPDDAHGRPLALVVGGPMAEPSGDDRTFWITDARAAAPAIIEDLSRQGLAGELLESAGGLKLFMLAGYVQAEDGRLSAPGLGRLTGVIGAAPVF